MISTEPIEFVTTERVCYLFYYNARKKINKCIGKLINQENDFGDYQYKFVIDWSVITVEDLDDIVLSGIDLHLRSKVYIRSNDVPYFVKRGVPQKERADSLEALQSMQMEYFDDFEYLMRSRGISHHTNCYVGRYPTDFCEPDKAYDREYYATHFPNLAEQPYNCWHKV